MKKFLKIVLFFLTIVILGSHIVVFSFGAIAKIYLKAQHDSVLNFSDISWKSRGIVIKNFDLKKEGKIHLFSPEVGVFPWQKEIFLKSPVVEIKALEKIALKQNKSRDFSWNVVLTQGTLSINDVQGIEFSLAYEGSKRFLKGHFFCQNGHLEVESFVEKLDQIYRLEFYKFPLQVCNFGPLACENGFLDGSIKISNKKGQWFLHKGCLDCELVTIKDFCQNVSGKIDFEGDLALQNSFQNFSSLQGISSLRTQIHKGRFLKKDFFSLDDAFLHLSFNATSGAKWEGSFSHEGIIYKGLGRGFLQSLQGPWFELEISSLKSLLQMSCREKAEGYQNHLKVSCLQKEFMNFAYLAASSFYQLDNSLEFVSGNIEGECCFFCDKTGLKNFKISNARFQDVEIDLSSQRLFCHQALIKENQISFEGASFFISEMFQGKDWSGNYHLDTCLGYLNGSLQDYLVQSHVFGSAQVLSADVLFEGPVKGRFFLSSKYDLQDCKIDLKKGFIEVGSYPILEDFECQVDFSKSDFSIYHLKGFVDLGKKIQVFCPSLHGSGQFDIRFDHNLYDIARLKGNVFEGKLSLDKEKSHVLGFLIDNFSAEVSKNGFENISFKSDLPLAIITHFYPKISSFLESYADPIAHVSFFWDNCLKAYCEFSTSINLSEKKYPLQLLLKQKDGFWNLSSKLENIGSFTSDFMVKNQSLEMITSKLLAFDGLDVELTGKITSFSKCALKINSFFADLEKLPFLPIENLSGIIQGEGVFHIDEVIETDLDILVNNLKYQDLELENLGQIHLFYSPNIGVLAKGIHVHAISLDPNIAFSMCKIGLLKCDLEQRSWDFSDLYVNLSKSLLQEKKIFSSYANFLPDTGFQGVINSKVSFDLEDADISLKRFQLPLDDLILDLQDIQISKKNSSYCIKSILDHSLRPIPLQLDIHMGSMPAGCLVIENDLFVRFSLDKGFILESIQGKGIGLESHFCKQMDCLVGSCLIDGNVFSKFLPPKIATVFQELKIGSGFCLHGNLKVGVDGVCFQGDLSGKKIQLFGFELENLFSQISWSPNHFDLSDLKISNFVGSLNIPKVHAAGSDESPWKLSIPSIEVLELRPSLLQDVGGPPGKMSPLVVRKLQIRDFQGYLEDSKTYTAEGELYFINSYKRDKSILELPSELLSRIVGLDFELLIPVCGTLRYELKNGFFHFTELSGSYSENKRSEFFLVFNEDSPKMDLDWNLKILIQMKQFVLFKLTEAFIISVSGKLDDPKVQLSRKKNVLEVF